MLCVGRKRKKLRSATDLKLRPSRQNRTSERKTVKADNFRWVTSRADERNTDVTSQQNDDMDPLRHDVKLHDVAVACSLTSLESAAEVQLQCHDVTADSSNVGSWGQDMCSQTDVHDYSDVFEGSDSCVSCCNPFLSCNNRCFD